MAAHAVRAAWAGNEPECGYAGGPPTSGQQKSRFACRSGEWGLSIPSDRAAVRIVRPFPYLPGTGGRRRVAS